MTVGGFAQYCPCQVNIPLLPNSLGKSVAMPSKTLRSCHVGVVSRASCGVNAGEIADDS